MKGDQAASSQGRQKCECILDANIANAIKELKETHSEYGNSLSDFNILNELGRGSYGTVYKVQAKKCNHTVFVLKKIPMKHLKPKHQREALQEVQILKKLTHPNIITYYTSFVESECLYILMEYAAGGDLYSVSFPCNRRSCSKSRRARKSISQKKRCGVSPMKLDKL